MKPLPIYSTSGVRKSFLLDILDFTPQPTGAVAANQLGGWVRGTVLCNNSHKLVRGTSGYECFV
jgi:hypothetical protein